jgi:hypothetical protein
MGPDKSAASYHGPYQKIILNYSGISVSNLELKNIGERCALKNMLVNFFGDSDRYHALLEKLQPACQHG